MTIERALPAPRDIFEGGGETGALMRSLDWEKTPLGPPERWPRTLRTLIPPMLASSFAAGKPRLAAAASRGDRP